ncbi:RNA-directed DNA polymerase, eukaryota, Reverse transcriptase zinc-binding domain protein [Artemisia annua]|uniref:RNA-directed DNA polymerase, eukaryota, Reverse transcriptase zinc-binding domain protein n=1 Tax=Artemisia annua TaxID=35608 RepID=A0A2U1MB33_ARTAN|nr:RNA-directed DNA polymerase, eukaryota, Reverse transcriptase zinc-binding domain protein [Artemisia annua]
MIISLNKYLPQPQVNLHNIFCKNIRDGCSTYFWLENWIGGSPPKLLYPRLGLEKARQGWVGSNTINDLIVLLNGSDVVDKLDAWEFNLNPTKVFMVSSLCWNIESYTLLSIEDNIRWNRFLRIKVNINTWRLYLDRLPTRHNLDARGIDFYSTRCAICDLDIETTHHLFVDCVLAVKLWDSVAV